MQNLSANTTSCKILESRVDVLETGVTEIRAESRKQANPTASNTSQTELKVSTKTSQLKKSLVRAEVHRDKDGVPQLPQTPQNFDEIVLLSSDNTPSTSADKEPFRLSSNERKKIRRGLQASKLGQTSQTEVKFRVQAAASSTSRNQLGHGHLDSGTSRLIHRYTRQLPSMRHSNNMRYGPRPNRKSRKYVHKQSLAYLPSDADYRDNFHDSRYFVSNSQKPFDRNYSLCNDGYMQRDSRYDDNMMG